ncbi:MAG: hypothetical protein JXJ19_05920 [Elusimicrobia bacterium]|nr:hypothetical protein [Elusimicrobiota bacterium]
MTGKYLLNAVRSWALWTGRRRYIEEAFSAENACFKWINGSLMEKFRLIASSLYFPLSENYKGINDALKDPWVDSVYADIASELGTEPAPLYPSGQSYALIVTHDMDRIRKTYQGAAAALKGKKYFSAFPVLLRDCLAAFLFPARNSYCNFGRLRQLASDCGVPLTLFILQEKTDIRKLFKLGPGNLFGTYSLKKIKVRVEELLDGPVEPGIHPSFTAACDARQLKKELSSLRKIINHPKTADIGARNHYLAFCEDTPAIQLESGLLYDSTMGFNFTSAFRCGTAFPFCLAAGPGAREILLELPLHIMDTALAYRSVDPDSGSKIIGDITDRIKKTHGVLTVNWHFRYINPSEEKERYGLLRSIIEKAKKDGAWVTTPQAMCRWWNHERQEKTG